MRRLRKTQPSRPLTGSIAVPGDKSISHRALLVGALGHGESRISNLNAGDDVRATADVVVLLGAECDRDEANAEVKVYGSGWSGLSEPPTVLDARNSGTTLRIGAGVCAGIAGMSVLTGDDSLRARPMLRVVAPLRQMGATIDGRSHGDRPPLAIRGGDLAGIDVEIPIASAQVKSALLLAGLRAEGRTTVIEPGVSRDHTERLLSSLGIPIARADTTTGVEGGAEVPAFELHVPGDISAAMFFVVAAALVPGSSLEIAGVGLNPTRAGALDALRRMGADIDVAPTGDEKGEPVGTITVRSSELSATEISPEEIPALIDEIPVLAVAATQARGETRIRGAGELRVKESDRIETVVAGLRLLGADAEPRADGLVVRGPTPLRGGEVASGGDHRIAMA